MSNAPSFLFAHGAGLSSRSDWMTAWATRLATLGPVQRFDYPYMAEGRKRPDRANVLVEAHRDELRNFRSRHPGHRIFLIGKSMGSRMGCHLANYEAVAGLICLGYPLCGLGNPDKLRDQVLVDLQTPILFVQGTRDKLCPLQTLEEVRSRMSAPNALHIVPTGDHSLQITKTHTKQSGRTQDGEDAAALDAIRAFVNEH